MRTMNAEALNAIAVHPEVRPWLGFSDPLAEIDLTGPVSNPDNFAFLTKQGDGGYMLLKIQPGLYAAHTLAMPSARGKPMFKLMREGFAAMFLTTDAIEIVSQVPDGNEAAENWSALAGFRNTFRREAYFPLMGERVGCQFKSLTYGDWVVKDRANLEQGQAFYERTFGMPLVDPVCAAWIGATIRGCVAGNATKVVGLYNRWSPVAGYAEATLLSITPPVVEIGDAVIGLEAGQMSLLAARSVPFH